MRPPVGESDLYEIHPLFKHICIEPDEWNGMTESQRRRQSEKMKNEDEYGVAVQ